MLAVVLVAQDPTALFNLGVSKARAGDYTSALQFFSNVADASAQLVRTTTRHAYTHMNRHTCTACPAPSSTKEERQRSTFEFADTLC